MPDTPAVDEEPADAEPAEASALQRWPHEHPFLFATACSVLGIAMTSAISYAQQRQVVQALGTPAELAGFTFTPKNIRCVATPPDDPKNFSDDDLVRPSQTCDITISIRNNTNKVASTSGVESVLQVGDQEYGSTGGGNDGIFVSDLFPDASTTLRVQYLIPPNVTPTVLLLREGFGSVLPTDKTKEWNVQ